MRFFKKSIFIFFRTVPKILEMPPTHKPFPTLEKARNMGIFPISHITREKLSLKHLRNETRRSPIVQPWGTGHTGRVGTEAPRGSPALTVRQVRCQVRHQVTADELPVEVIVLALAVLALVGVTLLLEGAASCGDRPISP